ncbi:hypothetical protein R1sor_002230 [Riccia sorocarpa]|uniref:SWIM-type domain-containing protein n=1 Tax=Riccia sorocarpa TaxID=122646 RepID=A0ABD3GYJ9_9MARC
MDPLGFVTVWCNRSRKPLVLFYEDDEVFAVASEAILGFMFKLEVGTGSIFIVVEERGGDDSDGDAFFVGRPMTPNEIPPPSWNLPPLQTGRYVVYGTGKSSDLHADVNHPENAEASSRRGLASTVTFGSPRVGSSPQLGSPYATSEIISVFDCLMEMPRDDSSLYKTIHGTTRRLSFEHHCVESLPSTFDGDMIFEFALVHVRKPYVQGEIASGDAPVVCKLCSSHVLCDSTCEAEMFYITPTVEDSSSSSHSVKTRAYMHVGNHKHSITPVISQEVGDVAEETIREILHASPTAKSGVVNEENQQTPLSSTPDTQVPDTQAAGCSAGGKRKFSNGSCHASAIPVASDSETSDDVVEVKIARSDPLEAEVVNAAAGNQVDENAEEVIFFHSAVRQFGIEIAETEVDERAWHISRTSDKSPVCRAKTRGTVRKSRPQCGAYVARQPYAKFPAPTFCQPQERYRETRFSSDRFWCCLNDVCSFGKLADFLERRKPTIPSVWLVVRGTHLTQIDVDELTKYGFRLVPYIAPVHVLEPSINDIRSVVDVESFPEDLSSLSPSFTAISRAGRPVNRRYKVSKTKLSRIQMAQNGSISLKARRQVLTGKNSFGALFWVKTGIPGHEDHETYAVHICGFPNCSCPCFVKSAGKSSMGYLPCKHIYFVLLSVLKIPVTDDIIQQPVWSRKDVTRMLSTVFA